MGRVGDPWPACLRRTVPRRVVREYYFNDHGEQINRFAKSLVAAAHGEETWIDGIAAFISMRSHVASSMRQKRRYCDFDLPRVDGGVDNDGN